MATTRQYYNQLKLTRNAIVLRMGVNAEAVSVETRALSNGVLACIAIVVKALTDAGVITDAQLQTAANNALGGDGSVWDREPFDPPPPT